MDGHGDGDGAGTGTGVEVNEGAQDGNGDGRGGGAGAGTGTGVGTRRRTPDGNGNGDGDGSEDCSGDGNGDDDNGTRTGLGRAEGRQKSARNRKMVVDAVRETGEIRVEREKKCRNERVGSVAANPDTLGSNKEAGGGAQGTQGSSKNCTSRESVSPMSRLIRDFRNKYH